jgi:hypothetical protein
MSEQPYFDEIQAFAEAVFGKRLKTVSTRRDNDWDGAPTIHVNLVLHDRPTVSIKLLSALAQQFERAVADELDPREPDTVFVFHYATAAELAELAVDG